ncbi:hypothetical protein Deipe_0517 [Deinococcus peraridilitoris DSM 19664]|uniref:Uncharacterized protein n=1 Tax=Deinococcus peraridilitoris (strain DSM 19664 / LMG 22246 / CIP 109416 / KR-200) TaxID=937777 RepID=K9ZYY4_DEIPD|nr:hypothetical protein Deipe_0517 [Deinococcus peraridilitoris DSM 19664]
MTCWPVPLWYAFTDALVGYSGHTDAKHTQHPTRFTVRGKRQAGCRLLPL